MKNLRRQESGQTAILLVMILPVVCLLFVLPLDAGIWYLDHRIAQNQADAAVLAAAQHLPAVDTTPATVAANTWLEKNGSGPADLACLEYSDLHPPDGRFDTLKVCVRRQSPGVFSQLAGLEFIYIGASASATAVGKPGVYSIFSNHSCPDSAPNLDFSGSNMIVTGSVHSSCNWTLSGSSNSLDGYNTYVGDNPIPDSGNICNGGLCNPTQVGTLPMPINYTFDDVRDDCTYTNVTDLASEPPYWMDFSTKQRLKPGVYCNESGKIVLSGFAVEGNITLVGNEVSLSGSNFDLTPYWSGILLWATGDSGSAIDASGSGGSWGGAMYAPNGKAKISGSSGIAVGGTIVADEVVISGSDITIVGNIIGEAALPGIFLTE